MTKAKRTGTGTKTAADKDFGFTLRIEATFGSEFQRAVAIKNLRGLLASWKALAESRHKTNANSMTRDERHERLALSSATISAREDPEVSRQPRNARNR